MPISAFSFFMNKTIELFTKHLSSIKRIGLLDSGIGGLTILSPLIKAIPAEFIYLADTKNMPYGKKSAQELIDIAVANVRFLLEHDVEIIIIACNALSAVAYTELRKRFKTVPIIEIIELIGQSAARATSTNHIGLLATSATINSNAYQNFFASRYPDITLYPVACPELASLVEESPRNPLKISATIARYKEQLTNPLIDTLILGCTHYSIIQPAIERHFSTVLKYVSGQSVFEKLVKMQPAHEMGSVSFYVNGDAQDFAQKLFSIGALPMPRVIQSVRINTAD